MTLIGGSCGPPRHVRRKMSSVVDGRPSGGSSEKFVLLFSNNPFQDNNGTIELDEFLSMMAMRMKANEKIKQVFDFFDTDCDG